MNLFKKLYVVLVLCAGGMQLLAMDPNAHENGICVDQYEFEKSFSEASMSWVVFAYKDDVNLGYISYMYDPEGKAVISVLEVYKPYRNLGIGSELLSRALNDARDNECSTVQVFASPMGAARLTRQEFEAKKQQLYRFYGRAGFKKINEHGLMKCIVSESFPEGGS